MISDLPLREKGRPLNPATTSEKGAFGLPKLIIKLFLSKRNAGSLTGG